MSGDYTQAHPWFKLRKAARYVWLYGFSRTLVKVRGQYHMRAGEGFEGRNWNNPACATPDSLRRNVGIIGCGTFAYGQIGYYLHKHEKEFLRAAHDVEKSRARSLCQAYGGAYATQDWREILADPQVTIVYIASNHASHADYAIAALDAGKHVHIEKPHVVREDQLDSLLAAMRRNPTGKVFLGFNRPKGRLFARLQAMLAQQSGPLMVNWFVAGHEIPADHWYFDEREGGRVLGNLCHWSDLTLQLVTLGNAFPCTIVPARPAGAKSDFIASVVFADGSCASITFSAKGHIFEGVREVLNVHRGDLLANLTDFQSLKTEVVEKKRTFRLLYRDHGHEANVVHSYTGVTRAHRVGESEAYIGGTARFFLAIKTAMDSGETVVLDNDGLTESKA